MSNESKPLLPYAILPVTKNLSMIIYRACSSRIIEIEGERRSIPSFTAVGTFHVQVAHALVVLLNRKSVLGFDKLTDGEREGYAQWRAACEANKPFRPDWYKFVKLVEIREATNLPA